MAGAKVWGKIDWPWGYRYEILFEEGGWVEYKVMFLKKEDRDTSMRVFMRWNGDSENYRNVKLIPEDNDK